MEDPFHESYISRSLGGSGSNVAGSGYRLGPEVPIVSLATFGAWTFLTWGKRDLAAYWYLQGR